MSENKFIPNSYQTPTILIDEWLRRLTATEWKLLSIALREYQRQGEIPMDREIMLEYFVFIGKLTYQEARSGLKKLVERGFLIQEGDVYKLNLSGLDLESNQEN